MPIFTGKCAKLDHPACENALEELELEVEAQSEEAATCPQCGSVLELTGESQSEKTAVPTPATPWRLILTLLAVAVVGAAGYVLIPRGGSQIAFPDQALPPTDGPRQTSDSLFAAPPSLEDGVVLEVAQDLERQPEPAPTPRSSSPAAQPTPPAPTPGGSLPAAEVAAAPPERVAEVATPETEQAPEVAQPERPQPVQPSEAAMPLQDSGSPRPPAVLARNSELRVEPAGEYCASQLQRGETMQFVLLQAVPISGSEEIPVGTRLVGQVTRRQLGAAAGDPDRLQIELTHLTMDGQNFGINTRPMPLDLQRGSALGSVARYGIAGAAAGATVAVVLRRNVATGAAVGGAVGGVVGGTVGRDDPCIVAEETVMPFLTTRDATMH